jgi:hypothetical protein
MGEELEARAGYVAAIGRQAKTAEEYYRRSHKLLNDAASFGARIGAGVETRTTRRRKQTG